MFSISKSLILWAALVTIGHPATAHADTIIVRSGGPSAKAFPPGKALPDRSKLTLRAGDMVTILDGRGTRNYKGPGVFSTEASSTASPSAFGALLRNTGARVPRTGATRGVEAREAGSPRSPNLWFIDSTKTGTMCLGDAAGVSIWRPDASGVTALTLTRLSDGKSVPLSFAAGQSLKAWPLGDLPITANGDYRIAATPAGQSVTVKFVKLGLNPQGLEATAAALIKMGCDNQLNLLVDTVATTTETGSSPG